MADIQTIDTDYKPWGGLAGYYNSIVNDAIQQSNQNALERQTLENVVRKKDAAVAKNQMNSPEWMDWNLRGDIGKYKSSDASGRLDQGVVDSRIATTNQENKNKLEYGVMEEHATKLDNLRFALESENPAALAQTMQTLDPTDQQKLAELVRTQGAQGAREYLRRTSESIRQSLALNAGTRGKLMEEGLRGENQVRNTKEAARGHMATTIQQGKNALELENQQALHGKYAKAVKTAESMFGKLDYKVQLAEINAALKIGIDPIDQEPLDERKKEYWMERANTLATIINQKAPQPGIDIPQVAGVPGQNVPQVQVVTPPATPIPGKPIPQAAGGAVRQGKVKYEIVNPATQ